jgi:hypothetical protein
MSTLETLSKYKLQVIYLVFLLVVATAVLTEPMETPLEIDWWTQAAFDIVEDLEAGDVVLVQNEVIGTNYGSFKPGVLDMMYHVFTKPGVKIIFGSFWGQASPPLFDMEILPFFDKSGKVYGEDYAIFGFYPGGGTTVAAFASDVKSLYTIDYYGNPADTLPVMDDINDGDDITVVIVLGIAEGVGQVWFPTYDKDVISNYALKYMGQILPGLNAGIYDGAVFDIAGAAQYEILLTEIGLTGHPGLGLKGITATNYGGIFMILMILGGNLMMIIRKLRGE